MATQHTDGGELMTAYGPNGEEVTITRKAFRQVYRGKGFAETKAGTRVTADTPGPAGAAAATAAARTPAKAPAKKAAPTRGAARKALAKS